jgi:hypothetical protein
MKKFLALIIFSLCLMITPGNAFAADINVECPGCTIIAGSTDPLFSQTLDGYWYPGRVITKTINLKNIGSDIREMGLKGTETSEELGILKEVMSVSISNSGGTVIWAGSLTEFYEHAGITLGVFNPKTNRDFDFSVSMDADSNNDYQGLESVFDLTLGFWGDVITPTPAPKKLSMSTGGGDGLSDELGCGSHGCNPQTSGPQTGVLGVAYAPGIEQVVLGATESSVPTIAPTATPEEQPMGEVFGVKDNNVVCKECIWWQILLLEVVLLSLHYFVIVKKFKSKNKNLMSSLIMVLAFAVFILVNKSCFGSWLNWFWPNSSSIFCKLFVVFDLLIGLLFIYGRRESKENGKNQEGII